MANVMLKLQDQTWRADATSWGVRMSQRTDASGRFVIDNVTSGTYTLLAVAPVVIGREVARSQSVATSACPARGDWWVGFVGNGVTTETRDGITVQFRDDTATRLSIAVGQSNVGGLEVIVRAPSQ